MLEVRFVGPRLCFAADGAVGGGGGAAKDPFGSVSKVVDMVWTSVGYKSKTSDVVHPSSDSQVDFRLVMVGGDNASNVTGLAYYYKHGDRTYKLFALNEGRSVASDDVSINEAFPMCVHKLLDYCKKINPNVVSLDVNPIAQELADMLIKNT